MADFLFSFLGNEITHVWPIMLHVSSRKVNRNKVLSFYMLYVSYYGEKHKSKFLTLAVISEMLDHAVQYVSFMKKNMSFVRFGCSENHQI